MLGLLSHSVYKWMEKNDDSYAAKKIICKIGETVNTITIDSG